MLKALLLAASLAAVPVLIADLPAQQGAAVAARPAVREQLQAKFAELHKAATFPGGTAGFVLADGSSFGIAVGVSDRAARTPMQATDRLPLGSVGKTYVSAVALQLIHEKKFGLDDTLDEFFGKEAWFSRIANGAISRRIRTRSGPGSTASPTCSTRSRLSPRGRDGNTPTPTTSCSA